MSEQGRPGRYNRSAAGLVGSMIVIVLLVVAFVLFRKLVSAPPEFTTPPLDYVSTVTQLQASDVDPIYPATLPAGWAAFNVSYEQGTPPTFGLSLHTAEQHFVGYEQSSQDVDALLQSYIGGGTKSAPPLAVPGGLATSWDAWAGSHDDHAFTARVGTQNVIVFGSAPVGDLETVVRSLTTAPLDPTAATPGGPVGGSVGGSTDAPTTPPVPIPTSSPTLR